MAKRVSEKHPEATITLRFAEVEHLIKNLEKAEDAEKKTVTHQSLMKRLTGIRDFWAKEEKSRKAKMAAGLIGARKYGTRKK